MAIIVEVYAGDFFRLIAANQILNFVICVMTFLEKCLLETYKIKSTLGQAK